MPLGQKCAPLYLFSAIWTIIIAYLAYKTKLRMPYMVLNSIITLIGLLLTAYVKVGLLLLLPLEGLMPTDGQNNGIRYFGVILGVCGCNGNLSTIIAFQSNVRNSSFLSSTHETISKLAPRTFWQNANPNCLPQNVHSDSRCSVAFGAQFAFAATGGIYASSTFMQKETPSYRTETWCAVVSPLTSSPRRPYLDHWT